MPYIVHILSCLSLITLALKVILSTGLAAYIRTSDSMFCSKVHCVNCRQLQALQLFQYGNETQIAWCIWTSPPLNIHTANQKHVQLPNICVLCIWNVCNVWSCLRARKGNHRSVFAIKRFGENSDITKFVLTPLLGATHLLSSVHKSTLKDTMLFLKTFL